MKLRELLNNIIDVNFDIQIKGVTCNPKRVQEGCLFVCVSDRCEKCVNSIVGASAIIANFVAYDAGIRIFYTNPQDIYSKIVSRFYQFKQLQKIPVGFSHKQIVRLVISTILPYSLLSIYSLRRCVWWNVT